MKIRKILTLILLAIDSRLNFHKTCRMADNGQKNVRKRHGDGQLHYGSIFKMRYSASAHHGVFFLNFSEERLFFIRYFEQILT